MKAYDDRAERALRGILEAPAMASLDPESTPSAPLTLDGVNDALAPYATTQSIHQMDSSMNQLNRALNALVPNDMAEDAVRLLNKIKLTNFSGVSQNDKGLYESVVLKQLGLTLGTTDEWQPNYVLGTPERPLIGVENIAKALPSEETMMDFVKAMTERDSVHGHLLDAVKNHMHQDVNEHTQEHQSTYDNMRGR